MCPAPLISNSFNSSQPKIKKHRIFPVCEGYGIHSENKDGKIVWLFNIKDDPSENNNLADEKPDIVRSLMDRLKVHYSTSMPVFFPPNDYEGPRNKIWGDWE